MENRFLFGLIALILLRPTRAAQSDDHNCVPIETILANRQVVAPAHPTILKFEQTLLRGPIPRIDIEFVLVNPLEVPIEYYGYELNSWETRPPIGEISPLYRLERREEGGTEWTKSPVGWCGTGAGTMYVPPRHAGRFRVQIPVNNGVMRVGLKYSRKDNDISFSEQLWSDEIVAVGNQSAESVGTHMHGQWVCVYDQRDGRVDEQQIGTIYVFDGTEVVHVFPDGHSSRWKYQLYPDTDPIGIDWRNVNDEHRVEPGIFWLRNDTLVFCDGIPIDKRPDNFSDGSHLTVLTRIHDPRPPEVGDHTQAFGTGKSLNIGENPWVDTHNVVVSAKQNIDNPVASGIQFQEGEVFIIEPDRSAKWGAHGPDGPQADYRGLGRSDSLMSLYFRVGKATAPVIEGRPVTVISPGELELYCQDDQPEDNVGQVPMKVIRLKTNK